MGQWYIIVNDADAAGIYSEREAFLRNLLLAGLAFSVIMIAIYLPDANKESQRSEILRKEADALKAQVEEERLRLRQQGKDFIARVMDSK